MSESTESEEGHSMSLEQLNGAVLKHHTSDGETVIVEFDED